jgi:hypothetical protein
VDNGCARVREQIPLAILEMDGMSTDSALAEDATIGQPLHDALAKSASGNRLIRSALGTVNVKTGLVFSGAFHAPAQRSLSQREGSVQAEESFQMVIPGSPGRLNKAEIFLNSFLSGFFAIAVGNFVAKTGAQAQFLDSPGDFAKGSLCRAW